MVAVEQTEDRRDEERERERYTRIPKTSHKNIVFDRNTERQHGNEYALS